MKRLVIDANIFVKLFHEEADSATAERLLATCLAEGYEILVPSIFMYEVLYVAKKRGKDARSIAGHIAAQPIQYHALSAELTAKTLDIMDTARDRGQGTPSFYDASYHALAILHDCDFITADIKHYDKTRALGHIKRLADIAA